jgi:hypothetical protein
LVDLQNNLLLNSHVYDSRVKLLFALDLWAAFTAYFDPIKRPITATQTTDPPARMI